MNIVALQKSMMFLEAHPFLVTLALVSLLILKGVALWKAARENHVWWFVIILGVNLLGILEMIYIIFISGKNKLQK